MRPDPATRNRHSIRLQGYDYAYPGAYFVTVCTWRREWLFGRIRDGVPVLNEYGRVVQSVWDKLPVHYPHVELDCFVIMPNHVHGIIVLVDNVGAGLKPARTKRHGLSEIIRALKTFSSRRINTIRQSPGTPVWHRNYHERVIRNDDEWNRIRQYFNDNPNLYSPPSMGGDRGEGDPGIHPLPRPLPSRERGKNRKWIATLTGLRR